MLALDDMDLEKQKNFYDNKRYFQGKDNPGDAHPAPAAGSVSPGQLIFGVVFLGSIMAGVAAWVMSSQVDVMPKNPPPPPAAAAKR
jgi:hypothetical protein